MVAASATIVTPMATANSTNVNPDCFLMRDDLMFSSGKRRDVADQRVRARQSADLVVNGYRYHSQIRLAGHRRDGDGARHPRVQVHRFIVGRSEDPVRAGSHNDHFVYRSGVRGSSY